jgi:hypothetical protein
MAFALITLAFQKTDKIKKVTFIFWPAKDALKNNFIATPAYILKRLGTKPGHDLNFKVSSYFSSFKNLVLQKHSSTLHQLEKA